MTEIFCGMCKDAGYSITDEVLQCVSKILELKYENRGKNFANAREVRNMFETAIMRQADRLYEIENPTNEQLCELQLRDVTMEMTTI